MNKMKLLKKQFQIFYLKKKLNKKAKIFLIGVSVIFVTYVMFRLYLTSQNKVNKFEALVGEEQLKIIETYKRGEKFLFFLDLSAQKAFYEFTTGLIDGTSLNCEQKTTEGYPVINSNCNIKEQTENNFNKIINEYLKTFYEEVPDLTYSLFFFEESIVAKSVPLRIGVTGEDSYNFELEEIIYEETEEKQEPTTPTQPSNPEQPTQPTQPTQPYKSEGKCGFMADYAKQYVGCPYSLTEVYILPPNGCWRGGLTCATFVGSVIVYTLGWNHYPYGHGREKCSNSAVYQLGRDPNILQPGDIFATEYLKRDGGYTAWGHTGMYVGKGRLIAESYGGPFCYRQYIPDNNGEHIFIHSYGWQNMGPPGVCYDSFNNLFINSRLILTNFCRPKVCA
ncbi:hypothetical protein HN789_04605 [archaeon]|jgi:hypothetical protein|nr:hypothetical protein [archaeon]MBT4022449.1 hypothetical protein [archaeon]MBT4272604.1 hypothetical protein [archaeon]MBT4461230.1 hypothetical protein [archaeon]MBT4858256.1 hypothetical protein [archaeon]